MFNDRGFHRLLALILLFTTTLATTPISAAELSTPNSIIGAVSGVGNVQLRGVPIAQEGTLFSGDQLRSDPKAYAKVILVNGHRFELGGNTDVTVGRENKGTNIQVRSGNLAFTSVNADFLNVRVGVYEVTTSKPASGNVAILGDDYFGLRVATGSAVVRNVNTKQSFVVQQGQERLLELQGRGEKQTLAQIASNLPGPIPAIPPMPQASGAGGRLSRSGLLTVLATIGGGAALLAFLLTRDSDDDLSETEALALQRALQNLTAISATGQQIGTVANQITAIAGQANTAILNAPNLTPTQRAQFTAEAQAIIDQSNLANQRIALANLTISQLQVQLRNTGHLTPEQQAQLNDAVREVEEDRGIANAALLRLRTLVDRLNAAGVAGTPLVTIVIIPPANVASPFTP